MTLKLNGNFPFDVRMRIIILQGEIGIVETKKILYLWIDAHGGQLPWFAGKLKLHLLQMIQIDVGIPQGMNEFIGLQTRHPGHHHRQKRIGGNIEGHPQEKIGTALVKLTRKLAVMDVKLKKDVAGRKIHIVQIPCIPGTHNVPARVGFVPDRIQHLADLINMPAVRRGP